MPEAATIVPSPATANVQPPTWSSDLARRIEAMPKPRFAVMDGARFPDLPHLLGEDGLRHRSLFLNQADVEVERAGIWLVPLVADRDIEKVVSLCEERPAAVFWSCSDGEDALHRHLRSINLVVVALPLDETTRDAADASAPDASEAGETIGPHASRAETVCFRHADPNVLASLLPLLDPAQFARIFGPADYIVMHAPDYGGPNRAPRPDDLPIAPAGLLRIREDQMAALEGARTQKSRRKIAAYLRKIDPAQTAAMSDGELVEFVQLSERSGRNLGLRSERAQGLWASMTLASHGRIANRPEVRAYLQTPDGTSADERVRRLVARLAQMPSQ